MAPSSKECCVWVDIAVASRDEWPGSPPDLDWLEYESLVELAEDIQHDLDDLDDGERWSLSLLPGEPNPVFSVPEAFATLVALLKGAPLLFTRPGDAVPDEVDVSREVKVWVAKGAVDHLVRLLPAGARPKALGRVGPFEVVLKLGDLSREEADALVNASNTHLKLGGGVSGALARAAGPELQALMLNQLRLHSELEPGDAVTTQATGALRCRLVIHAATVTGTEAVVKRGLENVLAECERLNVEHVAIPALGTGVGGL